jgi:uncharacterized protein YyaL (SSP411 family)
MHTNRLANEKSPYLLQHAHNPVDWHPWGQEAFDKARAEDKPIFLSIGYSTCHWCHVMERESFENEGIAELLNRHFVPIKVDREERPDVDRVYMQFVQSTTGSGGWPMSVWLTPDLKPFFGGTYFPPEDGHGRPEFAAVLGGIAAAWQGDRANILAVGAALSAELDRRATSDPGAGLVDAGTLQSGFFYFRRTFDTRHGGFGVAPKFPRPSVFSFLLREHARTGNQEALDMVLQTLRAMAGGGIHDRLGGGFHRYSVDQQWRVPHFEKMLYDQAQLAVSYLEAFQITGDESFAGVARGILEYVLRDMTDSEGGFYSAEDADSAADPAQPEVKTEGAFYLWPEGELEAALADPAARERLLAIRNQRPRPDRDDKILTAWNGLMISAFALAAQVLDDSRYQAAAERAAGFILSRLHDGQTSPLLRRYRAGEAAVPGFLEDYAFLVQGLLDLYETAFDPSYIETAVRLTEEQRRLFEDGVLGGFFASAAGDTSLALRLKDSDDGAEPSGNSVAALNLLRLAQFTARDDFRECAARTFGAFAGTLNEAPGALPLMLAAVGYSLAAPKQIVIAGEAESEDTRAMLRAVRRRFLPYKIVLLIGSEENRERLAGFLPAVGNMRTLDGKATAYVCENYTCSLPANNLTAFERLLG